MRTAAGDVLPALFNKVSDAGHMGGVFYFLLGVRFICIKFLTRGHLTSQSQVGVWVIRRDEHVHVHVHRMATRWDILHYIDCSTEAAPRRRRYSTWSYHTSYTCAALVKSAGPNFTQKRTETETGADCLGFGLVFFARLLKGLSGPSGVGPDRGYRL